MCGRTALYVQPEEIQGQTRIHRWLNASLYRPCYNVTPMKYQPVIRRDEKGERILHSMKWGLVPVWSKDGKSITINCRDDSVPTKPLYASVKNTRRCLVVCNGFYEWKNYGKSKHPFYFKHPKDTLLYMAAFYSEWKADDGESLFTYAVLTTESTKHPGISSIHERMPVFLFGEKDMDEWLDTSKKWEQVEHLIPDFTDKLRVLADEKPISSHDATLVVIPVANYVSSIKNDDVRCITRQKHDVSKTPVKSKGQTTITAFFKRKTPDDK